MKLYGRATAGVFPDDKETFRRIRVSPFLYDSVRTSIQESKHAIEDYRVLSTTYVFHKDEPIEIYVVSANSGWRKWLARLVSLTWTEDNKPLWDFFNRHTAKTR